jgi:outer membrane protein assembly factor BamA
MLRGLELAWRRPTCGCPHSLRGPWWLLILTLIVLYPFHRAFPEPAAPYAEQDYHGGFSTDFLFPYLEYNEKDGSIPGFDWDASSDLGEHQVSAHGGIGTESGKEQLLLGYTYLGWYPALGVNLFDKNTFFEDISETGKDEDDWLREVGGNLFVNVPLDFHHRISFAYYVESVELPDETTRLNDVSVSLVRDTAQYYIMETISGTQVNLTAHYGDEALGSERDFESYTGDLRLYGNIDLGRYLSFGHRLAAAFRVHGGVKKNDPRLFHLGGSDSLRGYDYHEFFGEKLWACNLELRYPAYIIRRTTTGWDAFHFHQVVVLAFVDAGEIWRYHEDDESLSGVDMGVGAGVRLQMFLFGKFPFVVGMDVARSVTDPDRDTQAYLVLKMGL